MDEALDKRSQNHGKHFSFLRPGLLLLPQSILLEKLKAFKFNQTKNISPTRKKESLIWNKKPREKFYQMIYLMLNSGEFAGIDEFYMVRTNRPWSIYLEIPLRGQDPVTRSSILKWSSKNGSKEPHVRPTFSLTCKGTEKNHI